jgi:hypothetical protein
VKFLIAPFEGSPTADLVDEAYPARRPQLSGLAVTPQFSPSKRRIYTSG